MALVAAFTMSSFASGAHRTGKPFNPLLGETFELDRLKSKGYRAIVEQVGRTTAVGGCTLMTAEAPPHGTILLFLSAGQPPPANLRAACGKQRVDLLAGV